VDLVARAVAQPLSVAFGHQVIVENRPGASGLVATQFVAKAAPDGYTLLAMANTFAVVPSLISRPGYDPLKDFTGISLTCWCRRCWWSIPLFRCVRSNNSSRSPRRGRAS